MSSKVAVLASFIVAFSLLACSPDEARRPDKDGGFERSIYVGGGGPSPGGERGETIVRTEGRVAIERAVLSSADEADLIHVRVEYRGSWVWPRCSLLEGPDVEAVRGIIGRREPPRTEGFTKGLWMESLWDDHESLWADRSTIEKSLQNDGTVIWIFYENLAPDGEVADPHRTPFFVRCAGGDLPDVVRDVAHVSGTPMSAP